jgi:hypothetical protein
VNRKTVSRWRKANDWDRTLAEISHLFQERIWQRFSDHSEDIADAAAKSIRAEKERTEAMDQTLFYHLVEKDANGNSMRDPEGRLVLNCHINKQDAEALKILAQARQILSITTRAA